MLSDIELCEFYRIDEDDVQTLEFVRFLLEVDSMESRAMFHSPDKLNDIQAHLKVISGYILDGTRSDELCRLLDETFNRFRNLKHIVEDIMSRHDINDEPMESSTNVASKVFNLNVPLSINKFEWIRAYVEEAKMRDLKARQTTDLSQMTLTEKVNYLLANIKMKEMFDMQKQIAKSNNECIC